MPETANGTNRGSWAVHRAFSNPVTVKRAWIITHAMLAKRRHRNVVGEELCMMSVIGNTLSTWRASSHLIVGVLQTSGPAHENRTLLPYETEKPNASWTQQQDRCPVNDQRRLDKLQWDLLLILELEALILKRSPAWIRIRCIARERNSVLWMRLMSLRCGSRREVRREETTLIVAAREQILTNPFHHPEKPPSACLTGQSTWSWRSLRSSTMTWHSLRMLSSPLKHTWLPSENSTTLISSAAPLWEKECSATGSSTCKESPSTRKPFETKQRKSSWICDSSSTKSWSSTRSATSIGDSCTRWEEIGGGTSGGSLSSFRRKLKWGKHSTRWRLTTNESVAWRSPNSVNSTTPSFTST